MEKPIILLRRWKYSSSTV